MTFSYPDAFARFYDLIYDRLRNDVDNDFFLDRIKQAEGKVLEIGVGTGAEPARSSIIILSAIISVR